MYYLSLPCLLTSSWRKKCRDGNGGCNKMYCLAILKQYRIKWTVRYRLFGSFPLCAFLQSITSFYSNQMHIIWWVCIFIISYLLHVLVYVTPSCGRPLCHLLKNRMLVAKSITWPKTICFMKKRITCSKTVCLLQKGLLAQKLYALWKKHYLLKNCMLVAKSVTCSKTLCFMKKALLAQKLYVCCKKQYLLKNYMLYAKSITSSKTVCLLQKALLAQKLYALWKKHY